MTINRENVRKLLQTFDFKTLFIEEMGWSLIPSARPTPMPNPMQVNERDVIRTPIAQMSGVTVFEIAPTQTGAGIPDAKTRHEVHKQIEGIAHENLIIFTDAGEPSQRTQSLWYWMKYDGKKKALREHLYLKGQPGDLFLSKLDNLFIDIDDMRDDGTISLMETIGKLSASMDVERITKKFYTDFSSLRVQFIELIEGIEREADRFWYASVLLNRLMFVYFLQKKGFIQKNTRYLDDKLEASRARGADRYYGEFLTALFFEGFAKPHEQRTPEARRLLGEIKYLNGGLFLPHPLEMTYPAIHIPDSAFANVFALFGRYSWHLDDTPGAQDNEINPDVLGYIFEKYINQKAFGAYYTRAEITQYLCERTINAVIVDKVNEVSAKHYHDISEILLKLDADLCRKLLDILPRLSILDPACGSGAFLVAAMKTMLDIYAAVFGKIDFLSDTNLTAHLAAIRRDHPSVNYYIRKRIITDNLYGVDIMEEATEIARLRLFLFLVSSAQTVDQLEPLPNIDFNIMCGNSLIGLLKVDEQRFNQSGQGDLFQGENARQYRELLAEKNRLIGSYRNASSFVEDLHGLRGKIDAHKQDAYATLDTILLNDFRTLKIQYEGAQASGKAKKRPVELADIHALDPFHWGYEFDTIIGERGGFDVIIANPPWEIFKPNGKEFFAEYSNIVTTNKMDVKEFEKEQERLLQTPDIQAAWLDYQNRFPYVSAYYRSALQFVNQISIIDGRKAGTDINLYKLFAEQCYNLLRADGLCGIVIPSGIYSDLGAKQLREMLFSQTTISGLFGFENRKTIFEGVDSRFKFVVLTYSKGGQTKRFPAAFMRHDVAELDHFPATNSLNLSVDLIRKTSPDSLSVMEFKSDMDATISEKMLRFPTLGEQISNTWNVKFNREFDLTLDKEILNRQAKGIPVFEGRHINQFDAFFAQPSVFVETKKATEYINRRNLGQGRLKSYGLVFREVARSTDTRTFIAAIIPKGVMTTYTLRVANNLSETAKVYLTAVFNSFTFDYIARIQTNLHVSTVYKQLPVPRLTESDPYFAPLVERAARLICTTPEFDDLAREVNLTPNPSPNGEGSKYGVTEAAERARLRAEIDGMVARLYGLTEAEFSHILGTFPLVADSVKAAALEEFRKLTPLPSDDVPESVVLGASLQTLISRIQDEHIRNEVQRGLNNLPNDPDMAVFKVSKIFEEMTKRYFMTLIKQQALMGKNSIPLTTTKAPALADIIDILVSNNMLNDSSGLNILRAERNNGAHKVRSKAEQQELLNTGEIYIQWYIHYLTMFEQRILDLESSSPATGNP